jgi:tmRNA-binding protein
MIVTKHEKTKMSSMIKTIRNRIKIKIAVAKGKKTWDKRSTIKERDLTREMQRNI